VPVNSRPPREIAARWLFVGLCAASLAPVLLVRIPAMVDYPDHLARMYILAANGTAAANPAYRVEWALYPNLAMDLLIPQMARLFGVALSGRIFLLVSEILIVGGAMAIERVMKGRVQLAGFAGVLLLYSLPFAWGFLNFEFGLGVALFGIALMLKMREAAWPVRLVVNTVFVAALFAAHFFALGVYGATLGWYELWRAWDRNGAWRDAVLRLAVLAAPAVVVLAVMAATGGSIGYAGTDWFLLLKPLWLFRTLNGYSLTMSAVTALALMAALYVAARQRLLTLAPAGAWMAALFAILYVAIPSRLFGTSFVDLRIIVAAGLIMPAFLRLRLPDGHRFTVVLTAAGLVIAANLAVVYSVWLSYRREYAAMIRSFAGMKPGARVLVAGAGDDPPLRDLTEFPIFHAPDLAVHYANAFVPDLFTTPGKQPVRPVAALQPLDDPEPAPVPVTLLTAIASGHEPPGTPSFLRGWYRDFDYVYVLGPPAGNPMPDRLEEVTRARRFVLYRIERASSPPPSGGEGAGRASSSPCRSARC